MGVEIVVVPWAAWMGFDPHTFSGLAEELERAGMPCFSIAPWRRRRERAAARRNGVSVAGAYLCNPRAASCRHAFLAVAGTACIGVGAMVARPCRSSRWRGTPSAWSPCFLDLEALARSNVT